MAFVPFTKEEQPTMAAFNEKFLAAIAEAKSSALLEDVKIATGSYIGTGTAGVGSPNTLAFEFSPKIVCVGVVTNSHADVLGVNWFLYPVSSGTSAYNQSDNPISTVVSWKENGVSWYADSQTAVATAKAQTQLNTSGRTYHYIAIG